MRTMFTEFPKDSNVFAMDDQWMVGEQLLVKPVTDSGASSVDIYLPHDGVTTLWYELTSLAVQSVPAASLLSAGLTLSLPVKMESIPVYIRGGSVLIRKMRLRRSSKLMFYDPYTFTITPDINGQASGILYLDDEHTFKHKSGVDGVAKGMLDQPQYPQTSSAHYAVREISFSGHRITCRSGIPEESVRYQATNTVERIELAGQSVVPKEVLLKVSSSEVEATALSFTMDPSRQVLVIKKPDVGVTVNWSIELVY